jgi:hypothetical protein
MLLTPARLSTEVVPGCVRSLSAAFFVPGSAPTQSIRLHAEEAGIEDESMIGETLGNYRIVSKIGKGGMGAVYLAEHAMMARKAAIKVLLPAFSHQPGVVRRFFNEARASARLQHPALVSIYDCGHHQPTGSAYLVMDYLEGESLAHRLRREGRLPVGAALAYARQIAAGMAFAHEAGIIHRDLKPGNIFLVPQRAGGDSVRILDFGVAKLSVLEGPALALTGAGMVLGTPSYMAPEQGRGGTIDARADVYALGCILFAMLCGRPPFTYRAAGELLAAHAKEAPPAPRLLEPSIPAGLEREILKALAKDPASRHPDMVALSAALASTAVTGRSTRVLPLAATAGTAVNRLAENPAPAGRPAPVSTTLAPGRSGAPQAGAPDRAGLSSPARPREAESTFGGAAKTVTRAPVDRARARTVRTVVAAVLFTLSAVALWRGLMPQDSSTADGAPDASVLATSGPEWTPLPPRPAPPQRPQDAQAPVRAPARAEVLPREAREADTPAAPARPSKPRRKRRRSAATTPAVDGASDVALPAASQPFAPPERRTILE